MPQSAFALAMAARCCGVIFTVPLSISALTFSKLLLAAATDDYLREPNTLAFVTLPANLPVLQRLLNETDFDPNGYGIQVGDYAQTPLSWAVEKGSLESVRALLAHPKTNPNVTDKPYEEIALKGTMFHNSDEAKIAARLLADARTNPNQLDDSGHTALYWIAFWGQPDVIKLVAADPRVDVNIANVLGAPLDMAASIKNIANSAWPRSSVMSSKVWPPGNFNSGSKPAAFACLRAAGKSPIVTIRNHAVCADMGAVTFCDLRGATTGAATAAGLIVAAM